MNWILLIIGGLFESVFAFSLSKISVTSGKEMYLWILSFILSVSLSMLMLYKAIDNGVNVSIGYAVWAGLGAIFKAPLNFMIDGINKFLSGIGKIKIPDWVPGVGGKGFSIPKIHRLAKGGIVSASTIANIGEAGTEAVIPLQRNTQGLDMIAEKISERLSLSQNDGTGATYVIKLVLDDGRVITKMVIDNIKDYEARTGKPVFDY